MQAARFAQYLTALPAAHGVFVAEPARTSPSRARRSRSTRRSRAGDRPGRRRRCCSARRTRRPRSTAPRSRPTRARRSAVSDGRPAPRRARRRAAALATTLAGWAFVAAGACPDRRCSGSCRSSGRSCCRSSRATWSRPAHLGRPRQLPRSSRTTRVFATRSGARCIYTRAVRADLGRRWRWRSRSCSTAQRALHRPLPHGGVRPGGHLDGGDGGHLRRGCSTPTTGSSTGPRAASASAPQGFLQDPDQALYAIVGDDRLGLDRLRRDRLPGGAAGRSRASSSRRPQIDGATRWRAFRSVDAAAARARRRCSWWCGRRSTRCSCSTRST